jgi:trimeric autotransporter adhesin
MCCSLYANTTGCQNVAVGSLALDANTEGNNNVAVGYASLVPTPQVSLTQLWDFVLYKITQQHLTIQQLVNDALQVNTTGSDNTAVGVVSLDANTTGTSKYSFRFWCFKLKHHSW